MSQPCVPGSTVVVRDQPWRVVKVDAFEQCSVLTLDGDAGRLRVVDPFDRVSRVERTRLALRRRRSILRTALTAARSERPATGLWTAARATIELLPYQLEPALAVLRGATRVLLADAVGLGKTIQAGLILSELRARGVVRRALIVCPVGLRTGWASELQQRFGISCTTVDQVEIAQAVSTLPPGINPWSVNDTIVASIDFIKRPEVLAALAGVPLDMVIADEAHHLTPGTARGEAVHALASRSPWFVMVTATPHSGDEAAFSYLAGLGRQHDELAIFRRSRRDAGLPSSRRERLLRMRPSTQESAVLTAVEHYARAIWREKGAVDSSAQLIAITIARRAASSLTALERTLRRRLQLLGSDPPIIQPDLPWDEEEADATLPPPMLAVAGLHDQAAERVAIERLLTLIDGCGISTKAAWIARLVQRLEEPAIVFTEYRDTLDALAAAMPSRLRVLEICGATPSDQRRRVVDAFNAGEADVLLATDTAGEGLNLHHRCRLVIDVELPWNPLRLEQRLGRVDRLGQHKRVHALRLFHPGTIEERVLECLALRRGRAERLDHPAAIDERAMAASVFESHLDQPLVSRSLPGVVIDGAASEFARLMKVRECVERPPRTGAVATAPRRRHAVRMCVLHVVTCINGAGAIVAERALVHCATLDCARLRHLKEAAKLLSASDQLGIATRDARDGLCDMVDTELEPFRKALISRIASIRSRLHEGRTSELQRSLFDRRAENSIAEADESFRALDAALQRRSSGVGSRVERGNSIVTLVAAWPEARR